jgi:hypothetical protein
MAGTCGGVDAAGEAGTGEGDHRGALRLSPTTPLFSVDPVISSSFAKERTRSRRSWRDGDATRAWLSAQRRGPGADQCRASGPPEWSGRGGWQVRTREAPGPMHCLHHLLPGALVGQSTGMSVGGDCRAAEAPYSAVPAPGRRGRGDAVDVQYGLQKAASNPRLWRERTADGTGTLQAPVPERERARSRSWLVVQA